LRLKAKRLTDHCNLYRDANNRSAVVQLVTTAIPFFILVAAMFLVAPHAYWLTLLLAIPTGALLTRFFALQHDCGHGSLFPSRPTNEMFGRLISVLTFTPYDHWRRSHALHHALSGNLDKRGFGDIETMTVREYSQLSSWGRLRYRLYRNPLIILVLGPPIFFLVLQRLAIGSNMPLRDSLRGVIGHERLAPGLWHAGFPCRPVADAPGASADLFHRNLDWRVAVLRAAPVRGNPLGRGG
jgi:omega-6 fatty acid desaturase (delta-12 desaturase)